MLDHHKDLTKKLAIDNIPDFLNFDGQSFDQSLRQKKEKNWQSLGEEEALSLFTQASRRVPAYKHFLKRHQVKSNQIKTIADFIHVPLTDKHNYIEAYSMKDRSWNGATNSAKIIAASSGTSGEPKFWPRGIHQELEAALAHELFFRNAFQIHKHKTLLVIGFPMGVYVSGMATVLPSWLVSLKNYKLTVVTVGNSKSEMLRVVEKFSGGYEQVVLVGHPFFLKDVLESGQVQGINWGRVKTRLMFCSEGVSEIWRDYILKLIKSKDPNDALSVYGSSELLLMGYETKLSIGLRRKLSHQPQMLNQIFGNNILPNIFQFNPLWRYIESVNQELVFTADSGLPLIRFNLHDQGTVISHDSLAKQVPALDFARSWQLPFVALWGRSDQTLVFYAANIYPEHVQAALQQSSFMKKLTGKFTMRKGTLKNLDEFLEINIELRNKVSPAPPLKTTLQQALMKKLTELNMEYRFLRDHLDKNLTPRINLWSYHSAKYFKPGLKPKYILKS